MPKHLLSVCGVVFITLGMSGLRLAALPEPASEKPLTVHEWGTFTALQDDDGAAVGAINTDDEPVPYFVCIDGAVQTPSAHSELSPVLAQSKGIVSCHPGVTMRLETPVIYFYPPEDGRKPAPVNVHVTFRGGWLTEHYPPRRARSPGVGARLELLPAADRRHARRPRLERRGNRRCRSLHAHG